MRSVVRYTPAPLHSCPANARAASLAGAARAISPCSSAAMWRAALVMLALVLPGCNTDGSGSGLFGPSREVVTEDVYAIRCVTIVAPDRFALAQRVEQTLKQVAGLKPELVQAFHDEESSTIYYGRYARVYDAARGTERFSPDYQADLRLIRELSLPARGAGGQEYYWPFLQATVESLPLARSEAPAEWNLARADGYWSYQVAVFQNEGQMQQRRTAAEQYARQLREQGEEAYFHHGPVNSSVCIGLFPRSAIQEMRNEDPLTGAIVARYRIVDPRMLDLQQRYPHNLHNGRVRHTVVRDPVTGRVKEREPDPSFPVMLPRAAGR